MVDFSQSNPPPGSLDWRSVPARARDEWIVSVDLGQSTDPSAVCVMHHTVTVREIWKPIIERKIWIQERSIRYDVLHLERLALGMPYPEQVGHVANILRRPPIDKLSPKLVIDETGVGRAVGDIFDQAGLRPERVTITAGLEVTQHDARTWHVSKAVLISGLDAALHLGELRIAAKLHDASALGEELKDFQRSVSAAGRATYAARTGKHDDLVLAVAIGIWRAKNRNEVTREELRI